MRLMETRRLLGLNLSWGFNRLGRRALRIHEIANHLERPKEAPDREDESGTPGPWAIPDNLVI